MPVHLLAGDYSSSRTFCGQQGCNIENKCECNHLASKKILEIDCKDCLRVATKVLGMHADTPVGILHDYMVEHGFDAVVRRYV